MKKWLLVVSLVLLGALAFAACGDDNGDANTESTQDDGSLPPVGDDGVERPIGTEYRLTISFNEQALDRDVAEIGRILEQFDDSTKYVVQESFPLTSVANLITDAESFCDTVVGDIEALEYVTAASCGPQLEPGDVDNDDIAPGELTDSDCEPVELRSDCGIDPSECNQVHNIDACTGDNDGDPGILVSPVCAPGFPDCDDTIVDTNTGGGAEGILPSEEDLSDAPPDLVPSPVGEYTITIRFNETVDLDQVDEVGAMIRDFDPDAEYVIQESVPPTGVANFAAETEDACLALAQSLETESFVTSVSCGPQLEPGDPEPDEPVVNDLE